MKTHLKKTEEGPAHEQRRMLMPDILGGLYALKKTLMTDLGAFEREFMYRAAMDGARELLASHWLKTETTEMERAFGSLLDACRSIGYADFRITSFDEGQKVVEVRSSDAPEGLAFQRNKDLQKSPVCSYSAGVLSWIGRMVFDGAEAHDSDITAYETRCMAQGNRECVFVVAPLVHLRENHSGFTPFGASSSERELRLNEEILSKNLELQALNLTLERQTRRKTEEVWRSEENYRSLMNLIPDPVAIITPNGRIVTANSAGVSLFGINLEREIEESNITSMLSDKGVWDKIVWLLEKEGAVSGYDVELTKQDGSRRSLRMSARFADLVSGRCVEAVFQDTTDRKLMEQQVVEAKSESEFFNDLLSHDIMNYAFSAMHFLDTVCRSRALTEEDRRYLAMVTRDLQGAFELSTSVRDLARLKTIQEQELVVKDLRMVILEAVEETKRLFSDRKIKIGFERDTEPRYVKSSALTSRVLTNLLTNAIKFNPAQEALADIEIEPASEGDIAYWQVSVTDYGKGIQDEEKENVFERFHRLDPTVKGTGLGLYVARTIADASGGRLWAENRVEGDYTKGTRMVLLLRKADEKEIAKQARKPQTVI